jgi:hypothetical protein
MRQKHGIHTPRTKGRENILAVASEAAAAPATHHSLRHILTSAATSPAGVAGTAAAEAAKAAVHEDGAFTLSSFDNTSNCFALFCLCV